MEPEARDFGSDKGYSLEATGQALGRCSCCGHSTTRVWGNIERHEIVDAVYFVTWTEGRPDHSARFDIVSGPWGEGSAPADRWHAFIELRHFEGSPQFMIRDGTGGFETLALHSLQRDDVIGTSLAQEIFAMLDVIYICDVRLAELRNRAEKTDCQKQ